MVGTIFFTVLAHRDPTNTDGYQTEWSAGNPLVAAVWPQGPAGPEVTQASDKAFMY